MTIVKFPVMKKDFKIGKNVLPSLGSFGLVLFYTVILNLVVFYEVYDNCKVSSQPFLNEVN